MELKLSSGDYVPDGTGCLRTVAGRDALIQRAVMRLTARRGGFLPLPEYGSRLYTLHRLKPSERGAAARQFALDALEDEPEVSVGEVEYLPGGDGCAELRVELICRGSSDTATLRISSERITRI